MAIDQADRFLHLKTPLGENELVLTGLRGQEEISRLFSYHLEMISDNNAVSASDIVGKNVTFSVRLQDDSFRHFNGFVNRFVAGDEDFKGRRNYQAEVVPWLWFLTRTADCRIFQNKTAPQIIEQIFSDLGFSDYQLQLGGNHRQREYCVQYRETDFGFVSRLLEEEGIFYFFQHEDGKHTMVIADRASAYQDCPESEVDCPTDTGTRAMEDHVDRWEHRYEFRTGKWAQTDYNFETPSTSLMTNSSTVVQLPGNTKYEVYDYPGVYEKSGDGQPLTDIRMEEEEVDYDVVHAGSNCKTFTPGGKFKLRQHISDSEAGKKYVITSIQHTATESAPYETGAAVSRDYDNSFTCIPDSVTFRPARITRKPFVQGVQTAVVVGPSGEEIYTDKYGRVKVQFPWDREGKRDESSSCWMRCMQVSAGKQWGAMFIPRIGQEVVVDFLEGDPDRPLVTGVVYNAEQMPAYDLPNEKTKSYIKTNSSTGGDGYNEIRFEDKAGDEQIFIHAQKDMDQRVKETSREYVGADQHLIVGGDQKQKIGGERHRYVKGDQKEKSDGTMSLQVGLDRHTKVGLVDATEAGQEIHLKAGMKVIIEAGMQISLVGPGGFVDIGPGGVTIQGIMVKINSGGAAGSGSGASPQDPEEPAEADDSNTGMKSAS